MMARGFKPVGWVAAVAGAALGCYMLSLNVASERADVAKLERQIISAKREIRALQTELGTRGRLTQLESWNAEVLALSAPTSSQFLENELTLARFDMREQTIEDKAPVRMAAAPAPVPQPIAKPPVQLAAASAAPQQQTPSLVRRASMETAEPKLEVRKASLERSESPAPAVKKAPAPKKAGLDNRLADSIEQAAKNERAGGGGAQ